MRRTGRPRLEDEDHTPAGFYDSEADDPAPWFLPGPLTPESEAARARVAGQALADWQAAQGALALELAGAAAAVAGLEMRLRHGRDGWRQRLVYRAVADLSWQLTTRVAADRLALYRQGVLSAAGDEGTARDLRVLNWAARRWLRPIGPLPVASFLGESPEAVSLDGRFNERRRLAGQGALAEDRLMEAVDFSAFEQAVEGAELHPFLRGAYALAAWQRLDLGYERATVQGLVLASVVGAGEMRSGLGFLPVTLGASTLGGGSVAARCGAWLTAVERGAFAALMEIDRLESWRKRAARLGRGGRGLPLVVGALEGEPVVSVRGIADGTGLSRASVQAILSDLIAAGLAREVTGNTRYRVFEAAVG